MRPAAAMVAALIVVTAGTVFGHHRAVTGRAGRDYRTTKAAVKPLRRAYWHSLWRATLSGAVIVIILAVLLAWAARDTRDTPTTPATTHSPAATPRAAAPTARQSSRHRPRVQGCGRGAPWAPVAVRRMPAYAARRAGVGVIHPPALRHSFATAVSDACTGKRVVSRDAGRWGFDDVVDEINAHADSRDPVFEATLRSVGGAA